MIVDEQVIYSSKHIIKANSRNELLFQIMSLICVIAKIRHTKYRTIEILMVSNVKMVKNENSLNFVELEQQVRALTRTSDLEQGRSDVLRMVAQGADITCILNTLCENAKRYNPEMFCSILRLDPEHKTLHPIASYALPKHYCDALDGVPIGSSVGSCGTAAFTGKRVIVDDINTHPYWAQYKELALGAGLQACWSEPILDKEGGIFGTFAMYYNKPNSPSKEDLQFIEVSANLAAVVFENVQTREKLVAANKKLEQTVNQRTHELEIANLELSRTLKQQKDHYNKKIIKEKTLTTRSLISGFARDVSTPLSTALTVIGAADEKTRELANKLNQEKLSRTVLKTSLHTISEAIKINQEKLLQASALLSKFNDINIDQKRDIEPFKLDELFDEIELTLNEESTQHNIHFEATSVLIPFSRDALWQVIYQLIENSIIHGFADIETGNIFISGTSTDGKVIINYQDDGCGIPTNVRSTMFEPFYTSKKDQGNTGLGMSLISSILSSNLNGEIRVIDSPKGARFEIQIILPD